MKATRSKGTGSRFPPMPSESIPTLEDRLAADVFGRCYREMPALKAGHYRWSHLAPQSVAHLQQACDFNWSADKLADYLHCDAEEASACLRRFTMSKRINGKTTTAARLRQAAIEWIGGVAEIDDAAKIRLADDLARLIGNQLYLAAEAGEDIRAISGELEGSRTPGKTPESPQERDGFASQWGPQWKD